MLELAAPQCPLRKRRSSDSDARARRLARDAALPCDCLSVGDDTARRPWPPSFSLAKTQTVSPSAISLLPYIGLYAMNPNVLARRSATSALTAKAMIVPDRRTRPNPITDSE